MQQIVKNGRVIQKYESLADFVEYAENGPSDAYSRKNTSRMIKFSNGKWEDAIKQAKTGNPELVKSFFDGVNIINAMIEEEKIGEIRDVTGEYFDVADFLSGEPEVFRRDEFGDNRPVVPVYANFAMNCGISNKVIENRGCGIVALCDELAKSGFIVDLNMVFGNRYGNKKYLVKINVRLDPLDLDTVAFIVANPLCYRRLWLAVLEHSENKEYCPGYGYPDEYDLDEIFESGLSGFYFVSSNHNVFDSNNYSTIRETKEHIVDMVERFKQNAEQVILG